MNDHDRNNLNFILALKTEEQFREWADTLSPDDMDYAIELLKYARSEVMLKAIELHDEVEDTTEANSILKKFTS